MKDKPTSYLSYRDPDEEIELKKIERVLRIVNALVRLLVQLAVLLTIVSTRCKSLSENRFRSEPGQWAAETRKPKKMRGGVPKGTSSTFFEDNEVAGAHCPGE